MERLRKGGDFFVYPFKGTCFICMLLSNNKEPRVKMFNDAVYVNYIYKVVKPKPAGVSKGNGGTGFGHIKYYFVGDQILRMCGGANLAGIGQFL